MKNTQGYIVTQLNRQVKRAQKRMKLLHKQRPLSPTSQLQRWLDQAEVHRLESGEVTMKDWDRYQNKMLDLLEERVKRRR